MLKIWPVIGQYPARIGTCLIKSLSCRLFWPVTLSQKWGDNQAKTNTKLTASNTSLWSSWMETDWQLFEVLSMVFWHYWYHMPLTRHKTVMTSHALCQQTLSLSGRRPLQSPLSWKIMLHIASLFYTLITVYWYVKLTNFSLISDYF